MSDIITSRQDANQVLRLAFDDTSKSLRITGSSIPGSMTVDQADGSKLHVTVDASALPTGAATEAKQDSEITQLTNINTSLDSIETNGVLVLGSDGSDDKILLTDSLGKLQVDVVTSGLPLGAATEIKQDQQVSILNDIKTNTGNAATTLSQAASGTVTLKTDVKSTVLPDVPVTYDAQTYTYVSSGNGTGEIETVSYRLGGASGTVVALRTLAYDSQNRVISNVVTL